MNKDENPKKVTEDFDWDNLSYDVSLAEDSVNTFNSFHTKKIHSSLYTHTYIYVVSLLDLIITYF